MNCRTLRVHFTNKQVVDYTVHEGGMWCWQHYGEVPLLIIRPGPGISGGVRHSGRYEIPAMGIAHVHLLPGQAPEDETVDRKEESTADTYMELAGRFDRLVRYEAERIGVKDWYAAGHAARTVAANNPDLIIDLGKAVKGMEP